MSNLFKTKFYDRKVVTVAKIVSYDPLKLSLYPDFRLIKFLLTQKNVEVSLNFMDSKLVATFKKDITRW